MITGIKRRNIDPDAEAVSILEKALKVNIQNPEMDVMDNPELNYKPILKEKQEPGLVGKLRLSDLPAFIKKPNSRMMGKLKLNIDTAYTDKGIPEVTIAEANNADQDVVEPSNIDPDPVIETAATEPTIIELVEPAEANIEEVDTVEPIGAEPTAAETSDVDPAPEPSDAEPTDEVPVGIKPLPGNPFPNKPSSAKIAVRRVIVEANNEISSDSDEPDSEDDEEEQEKPKKLKLICTFLTFWIVNALIGFIAYEIAFYPGIMTRLFSESKPNHYPLLLVPREKWSTFQDDNTAAARNTFVASRVTVLQTDTNQCDDLDECVQILINLERNNGQLPYNFVISSSGQIFEARGWNEASPMFPEMPTMVVAFIGDYDRNEPSAEQLTQLKTLLGTSKHIGYLDRNYKINGRKIKNLPTKLLQMLKDWKQYDYSNSDSEYVSIDIEPQVLDED